jgi:hypothetical protein
MPSEADFAYIKEISHPIHISMADRDNILQNQNI